MAMTSALLILSVLRAGAQEIVSAGVSRDTILIGDQIEWTSEMQVPRGMSVRIDSMSGYVVPGVELIGDFTIDTVDRGRDFSRVQTRAVITSFDSGSYVLPPLVVYVYRGEEAVDTLRLPEVPLEVTTIPIDTTTYEMYDIRPQFRYPVTGGAAVGGRRYCPGGYSHSGMAADSPQAEEPSPLRQADAAGSAPHRGPSRSGPHPGRETLADR